MATIENVNSPTNSQGLVEPQSKTADYIQEFIFTRTGPLRINMKICPKSDQNHPLYYANITGSFGDDTDLALHAGSDRDQPHVGTCHFNKFHAPQIEVHRQGGPKSKMIMIKGQGYHWSMPWVHYSTEQGHTEIERHFYWRAQEKHTPASPGSGKLCLELCSTDYDDIYATYSGAAPGTRKGGILYLKKNLGEEWKTMVILTLSTLVEKARQTRARDGGFTTGMLAY
ncbi:uncharacterized protein N7503_009876 [Penicillium pulvis]|uniref:uncharacterized protein n=1 Tax=Penicillium pulvis TaxID=1562058 RepID=UPI002547EB7F|nr:uncharacterized protein N7503_009876 [Penicillium pulvis]KAJ5784664.1 hypothetical protein N7503_009876 [Penicillium pulvis]